MHLHAKSPEGLSGHNPRVSLEEDPRERDRRRDEFGLPREEHGMVLT